VGVIQTGSTYCPEGHYRFRLDEQSLAVWAFRQGKTVALEDAKNDPRVNARIVERFNIRSTLATPLLLGDEAIGVLMAVTHSGKRAYQARDVVLIEGLAREAAITLHAQKLHEEKTQAEARHLAQQEMFGVLLNSTAEGIYGVDILGMCTFVNPACLAMLGYERVEDMVGKDVHALLHKSDARECSLCLSIKEGRVMHADDKEHRRADGSSFPVEYWSHPLCRSGTIEGAVVTFVDISKRKQAEIDLRISAAAFESQESMLITDAKGVILRVNQAFTESTGYASEEVIGKTPGILKSGYHDAEFYRSMWDQVNRKGTWQGEVWDRRKDGEIYPKWLTISVVRNDEGSITHYVGAHIDITERKAAEAKIEQLAFHDPLTRLPNRQLLLDRLQHALSSSARSDWGGALLFIDLDNFKTLNDTMGHVIGDQLLQQVAERLLDCVREGDTVARLGGDEFVVMLEDLSAQALEAAEQAEVVGEKILAALSQPYQLSSQIFRSSASIGAVILGKEAHDAEEMLKQADIAMYQAKRSGRNALHFFDHKMQEAINARAVLEADLHMALEMRQFQLHYQVQVDNLWQPLGAEALIRWKHPERGMMPVAQFIRLAEETGQILPIGLWVLEMACAQLSAWSRDELTCNLVLAVNISARQFHCADFVDQLKSIIAQHAINPALLKLELTEGMLLESTAVAKMNALKSIGVKLSLDDFGTGYSSLQYLKLLPLNQIKIDQSFVRDIATDPNDAIIVQTIIAMGQALGLDVIAEGVEMSEQHELLEARGCRAYQGYLFGMPMPINEFDALIERMHAKN
jgi:diguanylate cyclase (GGDEF)-like protein/PAS domain S-box-containing protein